jgi:hypothetical protein
LCGADTSTVEDGSNPFGDWGSPSAGGENAGARLARATEGPRGAASPVRRSHKRLTVLVAIAVAAGAAAVVVNATRSSTPAHAIVTDVPLPLQSPAFGQRGFTTDVPVGWTTAQSFPATGATDYELANSSSGFVPGSQIPPAGVIEIQILDVSAASVPQMLGAPAETQQPMALLKYTYAPHGATKVVRALAPRARSLAGRLAAEEVLSYDYHGSGNVQTELVSRQGGEIVSIEMDAAPSLEAQAKAALKTVLAHWQWTAAAAPPVPAAPVHYPPTGPQPSGEWIASGFDDYVTGDVANARLDEREVRAWNFTRSCQAATRCATTLVDQLRYGGTDHASLTQLPNNTWWSVAFPPLSDWCAREGTRPRSKETIRDTLHLGWLTPAHRVLLADETQTIVGCGTPVPATVSTHWVARPVPPTPVPTVSPGPGHAASAARFLRTAQRVCAAVNTRAVPVARRIRAAQQVARSSSATRAARAAAGETIARELRTLVPLSVEEYTQIPQPASGPLDQLWLRDIAVQRRALEPTAAAFAALQAATTATSRYVRTGNALDEEKAVSEATLFSEDETQLQGAARVGDAIERALGLPAICTDPPVINAIFSSPTVS